MTRLEGKELEDWKAATGKESPKPKKTKVKRDKEFESIVEESIEQDANAPDNPQEP